MPDPKLREAMAEIQAVIKKHDIGAVVLLGSESHTEFLREYGPTWSCIRVEEQGARASIHIKALKKDFPSEEAHHECVKNSVSLLLGFTDALEREREQLTKLMVLLAQHMNITQIIRDEDYNELD